MKSYLQTIGPYQILERLGRGGMADVYLATDADGHRVALKLVERGSGAEMQEIVAAERLGAELQAKLSEIEPRVPRIHSYGDLDEYFSIAMEFIEGQDLSALIVAGPLQPEIAAQIARELCSILRNAHAMSLQVDGKDLRAIVHGDIKPKNIRIEPAGQVRVLDFGIAKGLSLTRKLTSNLFGSSAYSSPERLESGRIDEMSDLWSVGIVLYEMVDGRLPFEAASTERIESIVRSRPAPRPPDERCPKELQQIIYKALASSAAYRYQTAAEFESDLETYLTGQPTAASREAEETRRTNLPPEAEETRRTSPVAETPAVPAQPGATRGAAAPVRRQGPVWLPRAAKWAAIGTLSLLVLAGIWETVVYRSALSVEAEIANPQMDGDKAWRLYQQVRGRSLLGFAAVPLRDPLRKLLFDSCQRTMDDYRLADYPKAREGDWIRCKKYMSYAGQLDPSDRKASAMYQVADGHILRINRRYPEAVAAFQHASGDEPTWPDPYLGIARVYIYSLKDIERGIQALKRAQDLGHDFGRRESAMMADAYKSRGLQEWDSAVRLKDSDQEKDFLKKAKDDLNESLKTYSGIAPWGESETQIQSVQDALGQVESRLKQLDPLNRLLPWNWWKK
jgi:eukaryotic-like serine/threonine-protein kinase